MKLFTLLALSLTVLSFSASAAVYNCTPKITKEWNESWGDPSMPADFFNARIEINGAKLKIDLKNEVMDTYGSCGKKKIGKFTQANIKSEKDGVIALEKSWRFEGNDSEDVLDLKMVGRQVPAELEVYYGSSCTEASVKATLLCTLVK